MAAAADDDAPAAGGGGNKKKLLIIVGAVVLLLGVNIAAMIFIVKSMSGGGGEHKAAAEEHAQPMLTKPEYVPLDPPFVVNFEDQTLVRFLQVSVEVMTRDPQVVEALKHHMPQIRNNLVLLFSNQTYEGVATRAGKEKLRAQALAEVQSILQEQIGKPGIEQIFFTSFVMQ